VVLAAEEVDIMTVILRTAEGPRLDRESLERVRRATSAYAEYTRQRDSLDDPEDDEGPEDEDAWMFEDLHVLMRMATRLRDKEQMIELIFEASCPKRKLLGFILTCDACFRVVHRSC
jgi:hypothetical protein